MPNIATRVSELTGEGALAVFARAKELERQGRSIIRLELGERTSIRQPRLWMRFAPRSRMAATATWPRRVLRLCAARLPIISVGLAGSNLQRIKCWLPRAAKW